MSQDKVYLAGPIQHVQDYGKGWREWIKAERDEFAWIDPMEKYDSTKETEAEWTEIDIVEQDLSMIDESDAILAHWDTVPTCGTPMEIFYAYHDANTPVVVQSKLHPSDISPWLEYHSHDIVESFDEAIEAIRGVI